MKPIDYVSFNKRLGRVGLEIYTVGRTPEMVNKLKYRERNLNRIWLKRFSKSTELEPVLKKEDEQLKLF